MVCIADVNQLPERLGHVFCNCAKPICNENAVSGLRTPFSDVQNTCPVWTVGNITICHMAKSALPSSHDVLDIIYSNIWGLMDIKSKRRAQFLVTFIELTILESGKLFIQSNSYLELCCV